VDANDGPISGRPGQRPQPVDREPVAEADVGRVDADASDGSSAARGSPVHPRLQAVILAGRYHGIELDPGEFRTGPGEKAPSAAALSTWAQNSGMWARGVRLRWRHLAKKWGREMERRNTRKRRIEE